MSPSIQAAGQAPLDVLLASVNNMPADVWMKHLLDTGWKGHEHVPTAPGYRAPNIVSNGGTLTVEEHVQINLQGIVGQFKWQGASDDEIFVALVSVARAQAPYAPNGDPNTSTEAILTLASIYTKKFRVAVTPV